MRVSSLIVVLFPSFVVVLDCVTCAPGGGVMGVNGLYVLSGLAPWPIEWCGAGAGFGAAGLESEACL